MYMDFLRDKDNAAFADPAIQAFRDLDPASTYNNADLDKAFRKLSDPVFAAKVVPSTQIAAVTGNTYCGSVYASLLSLLSNVPSADLVNKRIVLFSYGSGLASTMLAIRVAKPVDTIVARANVMARLDRRIAVPVAEYLKVREINMAHRMGAACGAACGALIRTARVRSERACGGTGHGTPRVAVQPPFGHPDRRPRAARAWNILPHQRL